MTFFDNFDSFRQSWQFWQFLIILTLFNNFDKFLQFQKHWQFLAIFKNVDNFDNFWQSWPKWQRQSCDIWDTDYNSNNWKSEFMTIFGYLTIKSDTGQHSQFLCFLLINTLKSHFWKSSFNGYSCPISTNSDVSC